MRRSRFVTLLLLATGSTAAMAWGFSSEQMLRAEMPLTNTASAAGPAQGAYCPVPPHATLDTNRGGELRDMSAADSILLLGGQSTEAPSDTSLACPGVPLTR